MDSSPLSKYDILKNVGGTSVNCLNNMLQEIECDYEIDTIGSSHYYNLENLPLNMQIHQTYLL